MEIENKKMGKLVEIIRRWADKEKYRYKSTSKKYKTQIRKNMSEYENRNKCEYHQAITNMIDGFEDSETESLNWLQYYRFKVLIFWRRLNWKVWPLSGL